MAHLKIQHRQNGQVTILDLDGKLTLGEDSVLLRTTVRALLTADHKSIVLNLNDVGYVDSSGLGELISAFTTAEKQDATLKLLNLTHRIQGLLQMTKLLTVFETFDSEDAAVASFGATKTASTLPR
jgi:anti-sigma B factor antagonist